MSRPNGETREIPRPMPAFIGLLYGFAVVLCALYVGDRLIGSPSDTLATFVDLDLDQNLSTWYASLLWFGCAFFSWEFARHTHRRLRGRSWVLFLMPALFLAFSIDEVARLHEALGVALDRILLGVDRTETWLPATGIWIIVFAIPLVIAIVVLGIVVRPYLEHKRAAFTLIVVGMAMVLVGALGIEALSNLVEVGSTEGTIQVLVEEALELVGATTVLWGCYGLVRPEPILDTSA